MGHNSSFRFYYPRPRLAPAIQALEACCGGSKAKEGGVHQPRASFDVVFPLSPDTPHPFEGEPEYDAEEWPRERAFHLDVGVEVEEDEACLTLHSPAIAYDMYFWFSRPVRARALAFGRATGARLVLEYHEGPRARELTEALAVNDGWQPWPGYTGETSLAMELRLFGVEPWAG